VKPVTSLAETEADVKRIEKERDGWMHVIASISPSLDAIDNATSYVPPVPTVSNVALSPVSSPPSAGESISKEAARAASEPFNRIQNNMLRQLEIIWKQVENSKGTTSLTELTPWLDSSPSLRPGLGPAYKIVSGQALLVAQAATLAQLLSQGLPNSIANSQAQAVQISGFPRSMFVWFIR